MGNEESQPRVINVEEGVNSDEQAYSRSNTSNSLTPSRPSSRPRSQASSVMSRDARDARRRERKVNTRVFLGHRSQRLQ